MMNEGGKFNFLQDIHLTNVKSWYLHLHNSNGYQNWIAGTSRGVDSLDTNLVVTGDVKTFRSREFEKSFNSLSTRAMVSRFEQ